jgi:hypothetical protein
MMSIKNIPDNAIIASGSIIRSYNVERRDVMKTIEDRIDPEKQKKDFYDYILVDAFVLKSDTFILVNITKDSDNKGTVTAMISNVGTRNFITGSVLKNYFSDSEWYLIDSEN